MQPEQHSKTLDLALRNLVDVDDGHSDREGAVPGRRPAALQPSAVLGGLLRQRNLLHRILLSGVVLRGGLVRRRRDAAGRAEEAGEPERPQAHEEGRLPRERRVQQGHSISVLLCTRVSELSKLLP